MSQTEIEWTDETWNPVRGCDYVSPGCARCYAKTFAERFVGAPGHPYAQGFDLRFVPHKLAEPLTWMKAGRELDGRIYDEQPQLRRAEYPGRRETRRRRKLLRPAEPLVELRRGA